MLTVCQAPFSLQQHKHLMFSGFLITTILTEARRYLTVALICISLMISYIEPIVCLKKHQFMVIAHFFQLDFFVELLIIYVCIVTINPFTDE